MSSEKKKPMAIALMCAALLAVALLSLYVGKPMVQLMSEPELFRDWVETHQPYSWLAYGGMMVFQIVIAFIPGEPFEIAAGYAFGAVKGTLLTLAAGALGSALTFWLVRRFGMRVVRIFFSQEKIDSVGFLKFTPKRDLLLLIVYMLPGTPKDLLGYFAGMTDIRFPAWMMISTLGRIPSAVSSVMGGAALGSGKYTQAIVVFAVTLAVSVLGLTIYNHISQKRKKK